MSDEKENLPSTNGNRSVELHGNGLKAGSLIDQAVSRLSKEQADNLMQKAGEEALRLEAKQHELNIEYVHAKKTVEDHVDTFNMLEKGGRLTRQTVTTDVSSGNSKMRIESKSGAACFVATAAYQNPYHPDVNYLRSFRDEVLSKNSLGRAFIVWYWRVGPKIAAWVENKPIIRKFSKTAIALIVRLIRVAR